MQTINLIGAGRVGQTLGRLWTHGRVLTLQDVLTRSGARGQAACAFMGAGQQVTALAGMRSADLWMLAVPDAHIAATAQALALAHAAPSTVFHCSGALGADQLAPLAQLGWHTASAHCILSFSEPASAVAQFAGTPCALEGESAACEALRAAFTAIGAQCFALASEHKLLYHAGAVFATNFVPVLQAVAEDAWRTAGVPPALLPGLRASLLGNALANITRLGPAGALTGPVARGDTAAIARQAQAVTAWDPISGAAYEALSALALRMAKATTETSATSANSH